MKMNRYTLCMAAAALFAVLALTGCSLLKVAVATGDPLSKDCLLYTSDAADEQPS